MPFSVSRLADDQAYIPVGMPPGRIQFKGRLATGPDAVSHTETIVVIPALVRLIGDFQVVGEIVVQRGEELVPGGATRGAEGVSTRRSRRQAPAPSDRNRLSHNSLPGSSPRDGG